MKFRSPLTRPIHPNDWQRPAGNFDFRVTSPFAQRGDGFHGALDIGNFRSGDDVVAAADGTVEAVGNLKEPWSQSTSLFPSGNFGGLMVVLRHGKYVSIYAHLSEASVKAGQTVKAGDKIGKVGGSGSAAGAFHLHFGIQGPETPGIASRPTTFGLGLDLDPWPFIKEWQVEIDELKSQLAECRTDRARQRARVQSLTNRQAKFKATIEELRLKLETDDSMTVAMLRDRLAQIEALAAAE